MSDPLKVPVTAFLLHLVQNPRPYDDCDVISITQSKNAASLVLHEYLHIIIRHKPSNAWRRLIAERQTDQDQVVIGLWPWVFPPKITISSGSISHSLPLPVLMRNLRFSSISLYDVAKILLLVHRSKPEYHMLWANCYWYADAVYQVLRATRAGPREHRWPWLLLRRWPVIPILPVYAAFLAAATRFQRQLPGIPLRLDLPEIGGIAKGTLVEHEDPYQIFPEALSMSTESGDEPPNVGSAIDQETEMSKSIVRAMKEADFTSNLDEPAIRSVSQERKADINAFSDAILSGPLKDTNLAYFQACLDANASVNPDQVPEGVEPVDSFVASLVEATAKIAAGEGPSAEEEARYDEALRAFAGGVLRELYADEAA